MSAPAYQPRISVRLYKTILRDIVYKGAITADRHRLPVFDLSDYLGDGGGVRIVKSVHDPAGAFTITFPDRMVKQDPAGATVLESIYGLVEPMDLVEIRFAHDPSDYDHGKLPIVMRGWVTTVNRTEGVGPDGHPMRHVVVSGQDFGKIWQILRIYYVANAVTGDNIISGFGMLQKYNIDATKNMPIREFIEKLGDKIVTPWLDNLLATKSSISREWMQVKLDVSALGEVNYQYINNFAGGSLYDLMADVCDVKAGFKELFVEDREDGIYLVCRQAPWYKPNGTPININTPPMDPYLVSDRYISSIAASRSDANVANSFWVRCPAWNLISDESMRLVAEYGEAMDNINCSPGRYGYRLLDTEIRTGKPDVDISDRLSAEEQQLKFSGNAKWMLAHKAILATMHADDVIFERGTIRMAGDEKIRAGMFLKIHRGTGDGASSWTCYVTSVDHEFMPFVGFFTTVHFERSTAFIERAQREDSPYLSEIQPTGFA